jgi:NADPH:quinone reductase-like Zn-dependent oxidoreductase
MSDALIPLANITLASAASTVTFGSIPGTYRDLRIVINTQQNVTTPKQSTVQFNGDASNYTLVYADGQGGTTTSGTDTKIAFTYAYTGTAANEPISNFMDIMDYSATDKHKSVLVRGGASSSVSMYAGRWASTAAITSIAITASTGGNWSAGTTLSLYAVVG